MMLRILQQYYPIRNVAFMIGEGLVIYCSVLFSNWLLADNPISMNILLSRKAVLITVVCLACLYYNDLYDLKVIDHFSELVIRLLQSLGVSSIILAAIYFSFPGVIISRWAYISGVILSILLIFAWRLSYSYVLDKGFFNQKIAIMGSSDLAGNIYREISDKKDCGYEISLVISEATEKQWPILKKTTPVIYLHNNDTFLEAISKLNIDKIIVALKEKRNNFPLKALLDCRVRGTDVVDGNSFYETLTGKLSVEQINPGWLIFSDGFRHSQLKRYLKRLFDLIIASVMIVILLPLIIFIAIIIKLESRGPVLFSQERIGEKRKPYPVYKFRSMVEDAEKLSGPKWAEDDDPRVTRVGKFIRKWRLDELPQLWNVLKGDMSFVGPRPERAYFIEKLEKEIPYYGKRFTVKPGLTGWAQVSYGYGATIEDAIEKLNYELFYIKNMSILMDIVIVFRTVKTVLFGKGAR